MFVHLLAIFFLPFLLSVRSLGNGDVIHERADTTRRAPALTGDTKCVDLMCISASSDGSSVEYVLRSTGNQTMAWMAMGYGTNMTDSAMVILWPNPDSSVTLSQRRASGHVMPTVDSSPPRIANFSASLSDLTGTQPKLGFTIPANSDTQQNVIWAFGTIAPSSSDVDATLRKHLDSGSLVLDLTKQLTDGTSSGSSSIHFISAPKFIVAHCILISVCFFLLPFRLVY